MKVLLLGAGFSKRMGELTEKTPKALLPLAGKPILNYFIEKLEKINEIKDVYLVSNAKYYSNFKEWIKNYKGRLKFQLLNDGTHNNEERLGAIGDILFSIEKFKIDDDLMIAATDNFFHFELNDYIKYFHEKNKDVVLTQKITDKEKIKQLGVAILDSNNRIISMEEKPQEPKSDIAVWAVYIYKKETLKLFKDYKTEGNNMDAPGYFVSWLYKRREVLAYIFEGYEYYDIGTVDTYNYVNDLMTKNKVKKNK